jgi:hypothetical protein
MTAERFMTLLTTLGFSLAEYATDRGHVAEAERADQFVRAAAPSSGLAWAFVWGCVAARMGPDGSL